MSAGIDCCLIAFLQSLMNLLVRFSTGSSIQRGKLALNVTSSNTRCHDVVFPERFSGSAKVRVVASISHVGTPPSVHGSAVVWTADVTSSGFEVCVMESGAAANTAITVNWVALQSTSGGASGGTASVGRFTSRTKCTKINFGKVSLKVPGNL